MKALILTSIVGSVLMFTVGCASSRTSAVPEPPFDPARTGTDTAVFAGGCFWGVEGVFEELEGVIDVASGYAGGDSATATYELVSTGMTDHAEAVRIVYDPAKISYGTLLKVFFSVAHDPTQLGYQGPDHGPQYRSAVFAVNEDQKKTVELYVKTLDSAKAFPSPVVTEIVPLTEFYPAEDYHQDFMALNPDYPYIVHWDAPKIAELRTRFPELLKASSKKAETWRGYTLIRSDESYTPPITRTEAEWKQFLPPFVYGVLREADTEAPFTGATWDEHRPGTWYSAATGQPLFRTETKFESGTGWPSFSKAIDPSAVILRSDTSHGMTRIEVVDSSSLSHLGHLFDDGPTASADFPEGTGLRFCMNSASMIFVADGEKPPALVESYAARK